jgi:hypothetical protein
MCTCCPRYNVVYASELDEFEQSMPSKGYVLQLEKLKKQDAHPVIFVDFIVCVKYNRVLLG